MIDVQNRRYIGSKAKLVDKIYSLVEGKIEGEYTFLDLFAGTGVVAKKFAENNKNVILNDLLFSNYISHVAWFGQEAVDSNLIESIIMEFNRINPTKLKKNYFSEIYGNKYFSENDAKKIGYIRDLIEERKSTINYREYAVLITSLLYYTDKIANTVGHFESFLRTPPLDKNLQLKNLSLKNYTNSKCFNEDANVLGKIIKADVIYIDPPYNARQYVNFYHVLENLSRWEKPTVFDGESMKFKRDHLKSGYSRSIAKKLMSELIESLECKFIVLSYNNTYNAKSSASNNKISENEITEILNRKGTVDIFEMEHKYFNAGKTKFTNHVEKLFICSVK